MTNALQIGRSTIGNPSENRTKPFSLPLDITTKTIAILAQKRVGKSYTAAVITEELLKAGQVPVVIDYTGAHWGLKASADGNRPGFPIVIFGGDHSDVPLEANAGEVVASAIVENRFPAIIDVSLFRKGEALRFLGTFLETIYRRNREPLHLVADEADAYAPQKPMGEDARTLGAMQDIVRRGGIRGIGCTLITQRPQILNKDVLTQAEILVALRLMHPRDIKAIEEWVAVHADMADLATMRKSLPTLPKGTAWFWAPPLEIFARVEIRQRETFDSGATPKVGEKIRAPRQLAKADLAKLGEQISATVARAKENDPAVLRARVAELERQLREKIPAEPRVEFVDRPIISAADLAQLRETADQIEQAATALTINIADIREQAKRNGGARLDEVSSTPPDSGRCYQFAGAKIENAPIHLDITGGRLRILTALAQHREGMGGTRLSLLTGISRGGGTWRTYMAQLRTNGYVEGRDNFRITPAGLKALGKFDPLPSGEALRAHWKAKLSGGKRRIFEIVVAEYPNAIAAAEVARLAGIELGAGTWRTYMSELRGLELLAGTRELRANDFLFQ